jgi:hypothetical protein
MKRLFSTKKRIAAGVLSIAIIAGTAGIAAAYFTSTGSGTGQASVGTPTTWGVSAGSVSGGPLYPGSGTETVPFTITNNGGGYQAFGTLTATVVSSSGNITQSGTPLVGCLATWFTATAAASSPVAGTSIAGSGGTATDNVTVTMLNPAVSQNVCQSATPDINLAVS